MYTICSHSQAIRNYKVLNCREVNNKKIVIAKSSFIKRYEPNIKTGMELDYKQLSSPSNILMSASGIALWDEIPWNRMFQVQSPE